jgi:hypothetical protein
MDLKATTKDDIVSIYLEHGYTITKLTRSIINQIRESDYPINSKSDVFLQTISDDSRILVKKNSFNIYTYDAEGKTWFVMNAFPFSKFLTDGYKLYELMSDPISLDEVYIDKENNMIFYIDELDFGIDMC